MAKTAVTTTVAKTSLLLWKKKTVWKCGRKLRVDVRNSQTNKTHILWRWQVAERKASVWSTLETFKKLCIVWR